MTKPTNRVQTKLLLKKVKVRLQPPISHPDPIGADYEQAFAGANFNTEVVSGALVEVSGCHFKALATLKVSGDPLKAPLKSPDLYLPAADNFCERSGHNLMK